VPPLQIQGCLPTKRTKVPGRLRVRRDSGSCCRCRSEELLTCPIIALRTGAVAKALSGGPRPILILNIAHKGGKAIEEASHPKVVDHVEQAKLCRVWKQGIVGETLVKMGVKKGEMVCEERVYRGMRQSRREWGAVKSSGKFAGGKGGDPRVFGLNGRRGGRLVVGIHEGESKSVCRSCQKFADGHGNKTFRVQVHPRDDSFEDFQMGE